MDAPLPLQKPDRVNEMFPNARWRKHLLNVWLDDYAGTRPFFAAWLCRRWDEQQGHYDWHRRVQSVRMLYHLEVPPPPGQPLPVVEPIPLWHGDFPEYDADRGEG